MGAFIGKPRQEHTTPVIVFETQENHEKNYVAINEVSSFIPFSQTTQRHQNAPICTRDINGVFGLRPSL
jgi:hypothetical protein